MAAKPLDRVLDLLLRAYLKRHPDQLRPISALRKRPERLLVVSSTAVGDTILSTPAIKSLRKSFPTARITALLHKKVAPLLESFPHLDEQILYHGGYKRFAHTVRQMRVRRPEAVLIFHGNGPQDIALAVFSGAPYILKHPTQTEYKKYLSFAFDRKPQHVIEERLDLVRKIGGTVEDKTLEVPRARAGKPLRLEAGRPESGKRLVGFQVGAANVYKMWPIERFVELAERILRTDPDVCIVITGDRRERELARRIAGPLGNRVIDTCGHFSIREWPALIQRLRLLVTNDTGTLHLAVALQTPTLSLFSATDSRLIGPYQDPGLHRVIQKDGSFIQRFPKEKRSDQAMRLISVDEVFAAYEHIMFDRSV